MSEAPSEEIVGVPPEAEVTTASADVPPGLRRARRLARAMDASVGIPLTRFRFGLDAVLGFVPGLGDAVGAAVSTYIVGVAVRLGVARMTLLEMLWNIAVEAFAGSVPVVGDLFDAAWRSNVRNVALLERDIGVTPLKSRASRPLVGLVGVLLLVIIALSAWASIRLAGWLFGLFQVAGPGTGG